jgi:hypothetical protein
MPLQVFAVLFVNIIHSAFVCVYEYQNLIDGFGNIATLSACTASQGSMRRHLR